MELSYDPRVIINVLWRRKWWFATPAVFVGVVALTLLFVLPPIYRSDATILIEDQDIPENIVPSLVNDYVDRRLDMLTRRVLQTSNLVRLIERYDLYPEDRETVSSLALAERMRQAIRTNFLRAEISNPETGRRGQVTVAFEIAFHYGTPEGAQRVTNELVSLYLSLNHETRREVVKQTAEFLSSRRVSVEDRVIRIEDEFAAFQSENRELLPEEAAFKRQLLANTEQLLRNIERDLQSLRERESFLTTQLALTDEFEMPDVRGGLGTSPEAQLEIVRAQLAMAQARYSANHPDIPRLQRELASLEAMVGQRGGSAQLLDREQAMLTELAGLRERYTDAHPDVQRVRSELASVRDAIAAAGGRGAVDGLTRNNAFVQLSAQLNSVQTEIGALETQRLAVQQEREALQEQLARGPLVAREYTRLVRALENAIADREALADKEMTAALSGALEAEAISERFVLAEPPVLPLSPSSPKETLILGLGLMLALGSGGASVVAIELLDRSIRSAAQLARILGDRPLVMIPTIVSAADRRRIWSLRLAAVVVLIALVGGGAFWVHRMIVPLDVLGYETQGTIDRWRNDRGW